MTRNHYYTSRYDTIRSDTDRAIRGRSIKRRGIKADAALPMRVRVLSCESSGTVISQHTLHIAPNCSNKHRTFV